jgi:prepilin-type N-terminal cleavage/methylation domain-containing protein
MTASAVKRHGDQGFTLVEVMAALFVFTLITLGVVPLLISSLRASDLSRSETIAENTARAAMERIEGLPYFVGYEASPSKVDLLDLYYPKASGPFGSGQSYQSAATNPPLTGTGGVFTTQCPPPSGTNPACPADIPTGYGLTFTATFVKPVTGTSPQTYQIVTPPSSYNWGSAGTDDPPAPLLDVTVVATWTIRGAAKSFQLRSILSTRHFLSGGGVVATPSPPPKLIDGAANLDYLYQGSTGFSSSTVGTGCAAAPCKSEAIETVGVSQSNIEIQDVASAVQDTRFGNVRIVRSYPSGTAPPPSPPPDLASASGAVSVYQAPPPKTSAAVDSSAALQDVVHPDLSSTVAELNDNQTGNISVSTKAQAPLAHGFFQSSSTSTNMFESWLYNPQADFTGMRLDNSAPNGLLGVQRQGSSTPPGIVNGYTTADTGKLNAADRRVETKAFGQFKSLRLLKTNLATGVQPNLVEIKDFQATVDCNSTADPATAAATASWSATLVYQADLTSDNTVNPTPQTLNLTGAPGTDPLASIGPGAGKTNYPVYDVARTANDLWLFDDPSQGRKGFLAAWSSNKNLVATESADGRTTSATIDGAIRIDTAPVNPAIPETTINLSVGKLSCSAVDNR